MAIKLQFPQNNYRRLMPFNRFSVAREDSLVIVNFALLDKHGVLLDQYAGAIFRPELEAQRKSLLDYLGRTGTLEDAPPSWQPIPTACRIELFNHLAMSSNSQVAETALNNLVTRAVSDAKSANANTTIQVDAIALLRSTLNVQKHLIRALFTTV